MDRLRVEHVQQMNRLKKNNPPNTPYIYTNNVDINNNIENIEDIFSKKVELYLIRHITNNHVSAQYLNNK